MINEANEISSEDLEAAGEFYDRNVSKMKMPTVQQVLDAAESCPEAKKVLETLFPDVFEGENPLVGPLYIKGHKCGGGDHISRHVPHPNVWRIVINGITIVFTEKNHPDKIFLSNKYCWKLDRWANGHQFLKIKN